MFALNKKLTAFALSFVLVSQSFAGVVKQECVYSGETDYFPIGDERGHSVLTKKEIHRDCNITITTQGPCKEWEEKTSTWYLDPSKYNTYQSNNNAGAIGEILSTIGAYDQIGHLWSGWKGYCEKGTKYDFSWASDPMFWASMAMSVIMEGSQDGGFLSKTSVGNAMNNATEAAGNAWAGLAEKVGATVADPKMWGKCLVSAGVDMASAAYNYFSDDDPVGCDPVDEFCEEENNNVEEDSVMTIDQSQYDDLIADNPEFAEYIVILGEEDGILTIRFKNPNEMPDAENKSQEEMEKLREKMKNMQFAISSGLTAIKMAACGLSGGKTGSSPSMGASDTGERFSVKDGVGMAINAIPAQWLGPYGALIKAGLAIALEFATSFQHINTCNDEEDAKAAGSRHLKTYQSLPYNLCRLTMKTCAQKKFIGSGCGLDAYHYCCYDQVLTKVLIAQIKAQLGRDWAHCTGITLRDLNFVSFRQCTDSDKQAGFDGTSIVLRYNEDGDLVSPAGWTDAKWLESYQHKKKCVDLTEFKQYLEATFSQDIDFSDFDAIFQDMSSQIEPLP